MGKNNGSYKLTGFMVLIVGVLFFLRDLGLNYIGNTTGWTIVLVLIGAGLISGGTVAASQVMKKKK
jgi:hypothetical protein